jgi:hypothetical protein
MRYVQYGNGGFAYLLRVSRFGRRDLVLGAVVGVLVMAGTLFHTRGPHVDDIKAYARC